MFRWWDLINSKGSPILQALKTNSSPWKIHHFDGIYRERWGFVWAMYGYREGTGTVFSTKKLNSKGVSVGDFLDGSKGVFNVFPLNSPRSVFFFCEPNLEGVRITPPYYKPFN